MKIGKAVVIRKIDRETTDKEGNKQIKMNVERRGEEGSVNKRRLMMRGLKRGSGLSKFLMIKRGIRRCRIMETKVAKRRNVRKRKSK